MNFEEMLFLKESYNETLENYNLILNKTKKFGWDWIIITASNNKQAQSYQTQIDYRKEQGLIPDVRIDIIPDENEKRIGSGGATLNVLSFLKNNDKDWYKKRILLIHSGGDSKRIPQYSSCGKLFSHVPRSLIDNKPSTLFDEFMVTLSLVPERLKEGILVASGDVLLLFNSLQLDVHNEDAIAISMKAPADIGKNHGVFLTNEKCEMCEFLHKHTEKSLKNKGAVDNQNMVNIDTGLIWLNSNISRDLLSLITTDGKIDEKKKKKYINDINRLSFYGDILYPLSVNGDLKEYLTLKSEGINDNNLKECRKNIWNILNKYNLKVIKTSPSKFIHVGTTNELRMLNTNASKQYSFLNWNNNILTNNKLNNISSINSLIGENVSIGNGTFIEDSVVRNANIGSNCVLTGVNFTGTLPNNTVLQILPLKINNTQKFIARVYGILDNPKESDNYLNTNFKSFLKNNHITKKELWVCDDTSLWNANLFEVCENENQALDSYNRLLRMVNNVATSTDIEIWKKSDRLSLATSYLCADMDEVTKRQEEVDIKTRTENIINEFSNGTNVEECTRYISEKNVEKIVKNLDSMRNSENYKLDSLLSFITAKYSMFFPNESNVYEESCYDKINKSLSIIKKNFKINEPNDGVIEKLPVRINFGGGWSDTPPYCIEKGGTVLNAAIYLNNKLPIQVEIKKYKKGCYKFYSKDLDAKIEYSNIEDIKKLNEVGDPFILAKAALICLKVINSPYLEKYGVEITTNVDVPKGSGLGTSSILAGAIVKALDNFYGIGLNMNQIFDLVLEIEQMISTGGGWQDQIGGLIPGIKLIETNKGVIQEYKISDIAFKDNILELEKRMVLIYTGQRRIAKNLLRKIMNKYIQNNKETIDVLNEIQKIAITMKFELEKGNIDSFSEQLTKHFELVKRMDSGITNVCIDHIISSCNDFVTGLTIAGAGGGGFLFAILKKGVTKEQLENKLLSVYRDNGVKVYDCSFYK